MQGLSNDQVMTNEKIYKLYLTLPSNITKNEKWQVINKKFKKVSYNRVERILKRKQHENSTTPNN